MSSSRCDFKYELSDEEVIDFHSCGNDVAVRIEDARRDQNDIKFYSQPHVDINDSILQSIRNLWDLENGYKGRGIGIKPKNADSAEDSSASLVEDGSIGVAEDNG